MTEELILAALILLIIAHGFLIRGCYGLHTSIPAESQNLRSDLDNVRDLLDEALDLIADFGVPPALSQAPQSPSFESIGGNILSGLISNILMPDANASITEKQENGEVYEVILPQENSQINQPA